MQIVKTEATLNRPKTENVQNTLIIFQTQKAVFTYRYYNRKKRENQPKLSNL